MERSFLLKTFGDKLNTLHHGQEVWAKIGNEHDLKTIKGRICINPDDDDSLTKSYNSEGQVVNFWFCQNIKSGCSDASDKFGYEYSWVIHVNPKTHKIDSDDCKWIKLITEEKKESVPSPKVKPSVNPDIDDDPMPEDWQPSEKDLIFFK